MPLATSGNIRLSDINLELGRTATSAINLGNTAVRALAGVASGPIRLAADFRGKSSAFNVGYYLSGFTSYNAQGVPNWTTDSIKVNMDTETWSSITAISGPAGDAIREGYQPTGGVSNREVGIIPFGNARLLSELVRKLTFSSDTYSNGGTFQKQGNYIGAYQGCIGTRTVGYFLSGGILTGVGTQTLMRKYTYSTDTCAITSLTAIPITKAWGSGSQMGNNSFGFFIDGYNSGNGTSDRVYILDYASDTTVTGGGYSSSPGIWGGTGLSGTTFGLSVHATNGIGPGNHIRTTNKFTYSSRVLAANNNYLSAAKTFFAGVHNSTKGLICGGVTQTTTSGGTLRNSVDRYTFSTEAWALTTNLPISKANGSSLSANPGYIQ